ncbi:hypothetical protein BKA62DRAFT_711070 [Auriculariales sp. MPI-PUGE-AT-0066]|nr:hypothetical protein BKA62DRAFT_711070 [Auriculariales sp. MPI-PUGE-AT-0066]
MNALADELLSIILAPYFAVPEKLFADNGGVSPFSKVPQSAADLLHVCKRWMRITTPLLYETVIIRSKAQASSLNLALTRHAEFGRFTRRLRLEGAYGEWVTPEIVQAMPQVKQFCFTLSVLYKDDVSGLQTAFELFQPERVIITLYNRNGHGNQQQRKLIRDLASCILLWKDLQHFTFSHTVGSIDAFAFDTLAPGLLLAPKLETITAYYRVAQGPEATWNPTFKTFTQLLAKPGLQYYILQGFSGFDREQRLVFLQKFSPDLRQRIRAAETSCTTVDFAKLTQSSQAANPFWHPMQGHSNEERLAIWTRILTFAFHSRGSGMAGSFSSQWFGFRYADHLHNVSATALRTASACLGLSKEMHIATTRAIYRSITLQPSLYRQLEIATQRDSNIPSAVQHLQLEVCNTGQDGKFPTNQQLHDTGLLARMTALKVLVLRSAIAYSIKTVWPVLRAAAGESLVRLRFCIDWYSRTDQLTEFRVQDVFGGLTALEELIWEVSCIELTTCEGDDQALTLSQSLCKLKHVTVKTAHRTFYSVLSRFALPAIKTLQVDAQQSSKFGPFFEAHGQKLNRIEVVASAVSQTLLDTVPNLQCLRISTGPTLKIFSGIGHANISRIEYSCNYYDARKFRQMCEHLTQGVEESKLPSLRKILLRSELWPIDEKQAKRNPWFPLAKLLATVGVTLLDVHEDPWRERLILVDDGEKLPTPDFQVLPTRLRKATLAARLGRENKG